MWMQSKLSNALFIELKGGERVEKAYLDKYDIMNIFDCCADRAMAIIRSIKSVSDSLKIKGKVTKADYDAWFNRPLKKDSANDTTRALSN